ncbi:MAG: hypothetical protein GQ557_00225 [Mycoplasmataceae bacterium]|nr:hypothetical protein [Mycoplasmataceae bacterium]
MTKIKIVELFAGIGSQRKAFKNLKIKHEIISIADWDIFACISYALIHHNEKFTSEYIYWLKKFNFNNFSHLTRKRKTTLDKKT